MKKRYFYKKSMVLLICFALTFSQLYSIFPAIAEEPVQNSANQEVAAVDTDNTVNTDTEQSNNVQEQTEEINVSQEQPQESKPKENNNQEQPKENKDKNQDLPASTESQIQSENTGNQAQPNENDNQNKPVDAISQNQPKETNQAPVLSNIGDKIINIGDSLNFTISGSDGNGDTLTFSASNLPSGASFNENANKFSWTPANYQSGTYNNVHFEVSDGKGGTDSKNITITVNNTQSNDSPEPETKTSTKSAKTDSTNTNKSTANSDTNSTQSTSTSLSTQENQGEISSANSTIGSSSSNEIVPEDLNDIINYHHHHDSSPALEIVKKANPVSGSAVYPGGTITYTLTVTNNGTDSATGAYITDDYDQTNVSIIDAGGGTDDGDVLTWGPMTITAGDTVIKTITVTVNSPIANLTAIHNTGTVYSNETSPKSSSTIHYVHSHPILSITKTSNPVDGSSVDEGSTILYTLSFTNTGNAIATGVIISDSVPANTSLSSINDNGQNNNGTIKWSIGSLSPGEIKTVSFNVIVNSNLPDNTIISNSGAIYSDQTNPILSNIVKHYVTHKQIKGIIDVGIVKTGPQTTTPGSEITYTLTYTNHSSETAHGVVITENLPNYVTVVDSGGGNVVGNTITWNIGDLAANQSGTLTFKLKVNDDIQSGTDLNDTATITTTDDDADPSNNSSSVNTTLQVEGQTTELQGETETVEAAGQTVTSSNNNSSHSSNVSSSTTFPATGLPEQSGLLYLLFSALLVFCLFLLRKKVLKAVIKR